MRRFALISLLGLAAVVSCRHHPDAFQTEKTGQTFTAPAPTAAGCSDADFEKLGRPIMFETKKGLFLGFSAGSKSITFGDPVPLYFWIDNQTDEPQTFDTCDTGRLLLHGYTIYDSQGHRVRERQEEWCGRPSSVGVCAYSCTATIEFTVPPHTCNKPQTGHNLAESYSLPPADYTLAFVDRASCGPPEEMLPEGTKRLKIRIDPYTSR